MTVTMMAMAIALVFSMSTQTAKEGAAEKARIDNVVELVGQPSGDSTAAALGWARFVAAGYKGTADHLGQGSAADAELALGDAMEKSVKTFVDSLAGKKTKLRLNEAVEGTVSKVGDDGLVLVVAKTEQLVPWAEVDPGRLALAMAKGKPTAEPDVATIAVLKLLGGEPGDAKTKATKLTGELGKKLQELLEQWKTAGPAVGAARTLDLILREKDATKAIERFKAGWPAIATTEFGKEVAARAREQFVLRGEEAYAGEVGLKMAIHGKVTINKARAHPAAGPGGVGMEIEFEFEKDAEAADFDPAALPIRVKNVLTRSGGAGDVASMHADQSRLIGDKKTGGGIPIAFGGDLEIEFDAGVVETWRGGPVGATLVGFASEEGGDFVVLQDFDTLDITLAGKPGPNDEKKWGDNEVQPGYQFQVAFEISGGKAHFARNGDAIQPLAYTPKSPHRVFVAMSGPPTWFFERFLIRGTATKASLDALALAMAEREAKPLFGE